MNKTIKKGETLLVDGPASVHITSGNAEVFGAHIREGMKVLVRSGKRLPFEAKTKLTLNLMLGEGAAAEEVEGTTIPSSWTTAQKEILTLEKPATIIVLGAVDSGKTSLCTYLCNKLLYKAKQISVVDGDLGQSDVGPPSTVGYALVKKPIIDIFNLKAENCYFVGFTAPNKAKDKVIRCLVEIKNKVLEEHVDYIIVNTDGWVDGEDAVEYKVRLIEELAADVAIGIEQNQKLKPILEKAKAQKTLTCEPSPFIKKRDHTQRRLLRELSYKKYLKGAKIRSLPLAWITLKGTSLSFANTPRSIQRLRSLQQILGVRILHWEEDKDKTAIVVGGNRWIDEEKILKFEETTGKRLAIWREGFEEGLLVALENSQKGFLGIGVIRGINYKRRTIKIYTPVTADISIVHVGQIRLDRTLKEITSPPSIANYDLQKTV